MFRYLSAALAVALLGLPFAVRAEDAIEDLGGFGNVQNVLAEPGVSKEQLDSELSQVRSELRSLRDLNDLRMNTLENEIQVSATYVERLLFAFLLAGGLVVFVVLSTLNKQTGLNNEKMRNLIKEADRSLEDLHRLLDRPEAEHFHVSRNLNRVMNRMRENASTMLPQKEVGDIYAAANDPTLPVTLHLQANALKEEQSGDWRKAILLWERLLEIDESNPEVLLHLAQDYRRLGESVDGGQAATYRDASLSYFQQYASRNSHPRKLERDLGALASPSSAISHRSESVGASYGATPHPEPIQQREAPEPAPAPQLPKPIVKRKLAKPVLRKSVVSTPDEQLALEVEQDEQAGTDAAQNAQGESASGAEDSARAAVSEPAQEQPAQAEDASSAAAAAATSRPEGEDSPAPEAAAKPAAAAQPAAAREQTKVAKPAHSEEKSTKGQTAKAGKEAVKSGREEQETQSERQPDHSAKLQELADDLIQQGSQPAANGTDRSSQTPPPADKPARRKKAGGKKGRSTASTAGTMPSAPKFKPGVGSKPASGNGKQMSPEKLDAAFESRLSKGTECMSKYVAAKPKDKPAWLEAALNEFEIAEQYRQNEKLYRIWGLSQLEAARNGQGMGHAEEAAKIFARGNEHTDNALSSELAVCYAVLNNETSCQKAMQIAFDNDTFDVDLLSSEDLAKYSDSAWYQDFFEQAS